MTLSENIPKLNELHARRAKSISDHQHEIARIDAEIGQLSKSLNVAREFGDRHPLANIDPNLFRIRGELDNLFPVFSLYLTRFETLLAETIQEDSKTLLRNDLEVQDNAYGSDFSKYLSVVRKGYGTNYHPCPFALSINRGMRRVSPPHFPSSPRLPMTRMGRTVGNGRR